MDVPDHFRLEKEKDIFKSVYRGHPVIQADFVITYENCRGEQVAIVDDAALKQVKRKYKGIVIPMKLIPTRRCPAGEADIFVKMAVISASHH